jgi:hypothetical protein
MSKQDKKFKSALFLQALLSDQKIKIGPLYYYLGGDLLDLCVSDDRQSKAGFILAPTLRQFFAIAQSMTADEILTMAENLKKSGMS